MTYELGTVLQLETSICLEFITGYRYGQILHSCVGQKALQVQTSSSSEFINFGQRHSYSCGHLHYFELVM